MTIAVLKTLVHSPEGEIPEHLELGHPVGLPSDLFLPKKALLFFYGVTEAVKAIAGRAMDLEKAGETVSIVEVSVDVGDAMTDYQRLPRDESYSIIRLARIDTHFREQVSKYLTGKLQPGEKVTDAVTWAPPRFLTKRVDLLEKAARTKLFKPVDVIAFHIDAEPSPILVALLMSSKNVKGIKVFGPHRKTDVHFPKGF